MVQRLLQTYLLNPTATSGRHGGEGPPHEPNGFSCKATAEQLEACRRLEKNEGENAR
jgi:hypothetical protein